MPTLGLAVANDLANGLLTFYVRGDALLQTIQERPLLAFFKSNKQDFPGGKDYVSSPVQGAFMSDTPGFFSGYNEDMQLAFAQAANLLRAQYIWRECHAGLIITWTELKKDGITVTDSAKTSTHSQAALIQLADMFKNRLNDYGESWARALNNMFWNDGSQDALQVPGILSLLPDVANTGTTGGLSRDTYVWWRHRSVTNIVTSEANQTLSKTLRRELIQLRRFGGRPGKAFVGADFLDALFIEVQSKGVYTQEGFTKDNDMGMDTIKMKGLGTFTYDPTLDSLGRSKYCYILDGRRLKVRPMQGEENKVCMPERPYNYMVFLKSMTWTGALECTQLNAQGVYSVA